MRTGAWSSGFGWRVNGGGFQQPNCRGFDSQAAKQNLPQELQEGFRNRNPPPLDRRGGLGGELFDFFFIFYVFFSLSPKKHNPFQLTLMPCHTNCNISNNT